MDRQASVEFFCIVRDLENIAHTLIQGDTSSNIEAAFLVGKLLQGCRESSRYYASIEPDPTAGMDKEE